MKFDIAKRERRRPSEWHWRFAWLPVRISTTRVVWMEWYYCRIICVAEGNWAGGDQWRWQTIELGSSTPYDHPLICN